MNYLSKNKGFLFALFFIVLTNLAFFGKFYFQGDLPFPGNLLVSYYFPWNSGGFAGFDPWTTRKDVIAADVIRQIYPWKVLAFDLIKNGQVPLWNPYNFSGSPLLANLQSSIFFPGSLLFLFLPQPTAWTANVIFLPLLFCLFVFVFLRSLKLSYLASSFGAIAASSISYIQVWAEQLVVTQSVLPLPLALWAINKYADSKKKAFLVVIPIFLVVSVFGGHLQTTVYVFLLVALYAFFRKIPLKYLAAVFLFSLLLGAIQLLPSLELNYLSAREGGASKELFFSSTFPWQNLITIVAPDFYGNPATGNFRGRDYGNFQAYFGIVALILAVFAIRTRNSDRHVQFFLTTSVVGLLFSLAPLAYAFFLLKIPVLSTGYPSRFIFLFQFSMAILSAFGLEQILNNSPRKIPKIIYLLGICLVLILGAVSFQKEAQWVITRNNLLLPVAVFSISLALIRFKRVTWLLVVVAIFEYAYFFNKYQPFAPQKFVFPSHPVMRFLQEKGNEDRFFGIDRAYVDSNFATYYRIYSPEGYDPLYPRRYGEFTAGSRNGVLETEIPRSDAWISTDDKNFQNRALDLLGVKYIIDKTDDPQKDWEPDLTKFPPDQYTMVWRINKWKIFERTTVLPRAFLAGNFEVLPKGQQAISRLYDPNFAYQNTLVLEKRPAILPAPDGDAKALIEKYSPNSVTITTSAPAAKLLFLSDTFYPGWSARVDGKETEILRANYAFRAVALSAGDHTVDFKYDPWSFKIGALVSLVSAVLLLLLGINLSKGKK